LPEYSKAVKSMPIPVISDFAMPYKEFFKLIITLGEYGFHGAPKLLDSSGAGISIS